jgi:uracil-DNA glycosylase family 4
MSVAPEHFAQVVQSNPLATAEAAVELICNDFVALPEHDVAGAPLHIPVTWLGTASDTLILDDEELERARRERAGWRKGPRVMLVLPGPMPQDISAGCALSPSTFGGTFLRDELERAGIAMADVLATHAVRFAMPSSLKSYKSQHVKANAHYVQADIENCRPEVIITLGAASAKAVLGKATKLDSVRGSVSTYTLQDGTTCKVVPTCSHMSFYGSHADIDQFRLEMARVVSLLHKEEIPQAQPVDYRTLRTAADVEALCVELELLQPKRIAFDTEWGNDVAREEYRYTLSVQLAWGRGKAAFVQFREHQPQADVTEVKQVRNKDGTPKIKKDGTPQTKTRVYNPGPAYVRTMSEADEKRCWAALQKLFLNPKIQLCGQHLRVDVEEFNRAGFNIDSRIPDGFDTMLVHYLLRGDDMHGLDWLVRTYAPEYGAYWRELEEWLDANGRTSSLLYGYRNIPPPILIPYGLRDADATWVVAEALEAELEKFPKLKYLYWTYTSWTSLHLLDVERNGLLVDDERRMELREAYLPVYNELLDQLRTEINWPTFSPGSKQHVSYLLFNQYVYKDRDKGKAEAPPDAKLMLLRPLYNTDKYPKPWDDVELEGDAEVSTPSTESDVFDILSADNPDLKALTLLTHISVLSKFLSSYLSPIVMNEYGVPEDGKGFHCNIRSDHRVTTKLSQLTATGRYTSQKTNLQTSPKKQEAALLKALIFHKFGISQAEYEKRTFDGDKEKGKPAYAGADRIEPADRIVLHKFKTCIVAPEGYSLIEVDFKTAELFVWAYASGDLNLIEVVASGRDLHSEVAIMSYNLPMKAELPAAIEAFKKGDKGLYKAIVALVKSKYEALRTAAKSTIFGVMYGRSAGALSRALTSTGTPTTPDECQAIIDGIAKNYPVAWKWLKDNAEAAVKNGYIENVFGAKRYFPGVEKMTEGQRAAVQREAKNSPIQGAVAYLLAQAGINFYKFKYMTERGRALDFRILLPIHDAFLIEAKDEHVPAVIQLIHLCMSLLNKIPGTDYYLGVDIEVAKRWGEKAH